MAYTRISEYVALAKRLAEERGGSLRVTEIAAKHPALVSAIYRKPEAFAEVNLVKRVAQTTKDTYIKQAEELAAAHGGVLPPHVDLLRISRPLTYYIINHPGDFAHLKRGHTRARLERIEAAVKEAEALAAASADGRLWITKRMHAKHNKLILTMRRYPEYFTHIPRRRRALVSLEERVKAAEALAAANGGFLPHHGILRRKDAGLRNTIIKYPEAFAHIPRQSCRRSTAELVKRAEDLARQNGGFLPHASALKKLDHSLAITLYRRPGIFAHLKQEIRESRGKIIGIRGGSAEANSIPIPISSSASPNQVGNSPVEIEECYDPERKYEEIPDRIPAESVD